MLPPDNHQFHNLLPSSAAAAEGATTTANTMSTHSDKDEEGEVPSSSSAAVGSAQWSCCSYPTALVVAKLYIKKLFIILRFNI
jgi:hypothetical protein